MLFPDFLFRNYFDFGFRISDFGFSISALEFKSDGHTGKYSE